jgi:hypothetical protein
MCGSGLVDSTDKFPSFVVFDQPHAQICLVPCNFGF